MLKGVIAKCDGCNKSFTSKELIWNAVKNWVRKLNQQQVPIFPNLEKGYPLTKYQMESLALRFSYDMEFYNRQPCEEMEQILKTIVLLHYNEHDHRHRKNCFKKSNECRFSFPRQIQSDNEIVVNWSSEPFKWFSVSCERPFSLCFPFTIESKRHVPDLFLNTNNPVISKIFGYNNNVMMGNRNCIYYVTLYNTKGNQEEEQFPFLKHCTALAKRIRKLRQAEMEIENQFGNNGEVRTYAQTPNFSVGLGHVLSGIIAHLSSTVISATMAWHLVIKESRFQFSHEFSHILLSQFESWLKDEDIHFRFRRTKNEGTGWVDSNLFQYLYRPDYEHFDSICVWEYFKDYEMRLISSLSSNQKANLENDYEENQFFKFNEMYPGHQFACVERLKKSKVPMLYYNDKIPDVELCKLGTAFGENDIDATTTSIRNEYATKMLLLFFPFRDKVDFPKFEDRWKFFQNCSKSGLLYWDSDRLMQNIQDVENSKKILSTNDDLTNKTEKPNLSPDFNLDYGDGEEDEDNGNLGVPSSSSNSDEVNLDLIVEEFGIYEKSVLGEILKDNVIGSLNNEMKEIHIITNPISQTSSVVLDEEQEPSVTENQSSIDGGIPARYNDVVKIILNLDKNRENGKNGLETTSEDPNFGFESTTLSMKSCIQQFNLDPKQAAAFNVICSSFMLAFLNDPTITKFGTDIEKQQATKILMERGATSRLIMHLTGSGGSGKSFVLKATKTFCEQFCNLIGQPFDDSVFIVSATTNTAAAQVQGDTIHSLVGLRSKFSNILRNGKVNWKVTKILFLDEISMFDIKDFLKLDKYLRHFMAQYNPEAMNFPFGGLNIVLCGDFSQLNPIGRSVIYDKNVNALWNLINRVVILNFKNHRFATDPGWGESLQRIHLGRTRKEDVEKINTRVVGPNLSLPSLEELNGADITYACATNADRNLICDNIFASILKQRHPKEDQDFMVPEETIMIKGNFMDLKTDESKSAAYHKMVHSKCGDDNVQCGNKQNIIRVDPCLKLFKGCPIMVSTNDNKNLGAVKGTTAKFLGVKLKRGKSPKVEIWNGYKVHTVEANDVQFILCEHTKKSVNEPSRTFKLPPKIFHVTVKFPIGTSNKFLNLEKSRILMFPVNNDLATTGHKLQGMTKKFLIVSSINYNTANWIYVVLSRVTSLDGLFLMQPLKPNFNPKPTKLLQQEWMFQRHLERDTLLHLQQFGNFPIEIDLTTIDEAVEINLPTTDAAQSTELDGEQPKKKYKSSNSKNPKKTKKQKFQLLQSENGITLSPTVHSFDLWLSSKNMERIPHQTSQYGNCLYESVANCIQLWEGKQVELRLQTINWARLQVTQGTQWGREISQTFQDREGNLDNYGKHSFLEYLDFMENPYTYGTEYDIIMLCAFLNISIDVYTSSLLSIIGGELRSERPLHFGGIRDTNVILRHYKEHYEPIKLL